MTTSGISELFRFARLRGRTHGSASIASVWRTVCVLLLLCAASAVASPAQTFRTLVSFDGANGSEPYSSLVQGLDGNFYGTTGDGGAYGYGTIIKITRAGALTVVHSFSDGYDGADPGVLVQATDGNFYGITAGGSSAVFKISPSGTLTRLGNGFGTTGGDQIPISPSGLVQASDGNFYGTTLNGGSIADCLYRDGCGSVFKMSPSGTLTVLYAFYLFDGYGAAYPTGLVQATDGNFYGTTGDGGANGYGTVFKITPRVG